MSDLTFEPAAPVKRPFSGGKTAAPNPYVSAIQSIALKKDDSDEPQALSHIVTHENADAVKTDRSRIVRQITTAAKNNNPVCTGRTDFTDAHELFTSGAKKGEVKTYRTKVVFWTVPPYKSKPRAKKVTDDAQTNTNVTTDVQQ